jgi:hypothetical protein
MSDDPLILYIVFPEDIATRLTPGQIAAQAAHASTVHAIYSIEARDPDFYDWKSDDYQFGITLVGVTNTFKALCQRMVVDPYVHFLNKEDDTVTTEYYVPTCGFFMCRKSEFPEDFDFRLLREEYLR